MGVDCLAAPVAQPVRGLAEDDHTEEDQADDEHARDDLLALCRGILDGKQLEQRKHRRDSN
jgi:hypothetical protein